MELSSALCRTQEARQRERAETATLENERIVAERAAEAWRIEGISAMRNEARRVRTRAIAEIASLEKGRMNEQDALAPADEPHREDG